VRTVNKKKQKKKTLGWDAVRRFWFRQEAGSGGQGKVKCKIGIIVSEKNNKCAK
jgi:hypothetical protein